MEIKISEPHLSFIVSRLGNSNSDLLTQLQGRFTASSFSINADNAIKLRDWLEEQLRLMDCGGKCEPAEKKKILRDIITRTRRSQKLMRGEDMMNLKLSKTHIAFLKSRLQNSESYFFTILQDGTIASYFSLDLDDNLTIKLHDWVGEQLQFVGFDKDYNLTKSGQMLEDIIDLLS